MIIELVLGPSHSRFGVMARDSEAFEVRPFPKIRRAYVDVLREGHRRHIIHGLVEVDVTRARSTIRDQPVEEDDDRLSFTGFLVACVGRAVDEDRMLHAHRWGRRKLLAAPCFVERGSTVCPEESGQDVTLYLSAQMDEQSSVDR